MSIKNEIERIKATLTPEAKLIAVSKTKPIEMLQEAYDAGQRLFGENKALEMRDKHLALPDDIKWHFIGHLQTNKIKYIIDYVTLIHSIDSWFEDGFHTYLCYIIGIIRIWSDGTHTAGVKTFITI